MKRKILATVFACLAAALYAINIPVSKILSAHASSVMMAAFLYLGAGVGLFIYGLIAKAVKREENLKKLNKKDMPFVIGMVVLDIAAPILLMIGIRYTSASNAALLNNFEIVATTLIAFVVFKEMVSPKLWIAIITVTLSGVILSFEGWGSFNFNFGSLLVLGACVCWGLENNCTRKISNKSATDIVVIKGCFSGLGSLIVALIVGERFPALDIIFLIALLGFVAYGLSIKFYITAQSELGAAKTSAYYSIAPFLGVLFGIVFLKEVPEFNFYIALVLMIAATILMVKDTFETYHKHEHTHMQKHAHLNGDKKITHEHTFTHTHAHLHKVDGEDKHVHMHLTKEKHIHL
ncbi:MAG: DMT family transporter [Clostridiales bacterium]|nr:DMT family transporter [Clostridiales bacterium]